MTRHRQLVALVCIAAVFFAGVLPGVAYLLCDAVVPLGPLFGLVVCAVAPAPDDAVLPAAPAFIVPSPRAPPAA